MLNAASIAALPLLAVCGAPMMALLLGIAGTAIAARSSYADGRAYAPWIVGATALASTLGAWSVALASIIYFSVQWWNTLHQGASVFRAGGSTIATSMLVPLLVMAAAFTGLFVVLHLMSMRNEILRRRIRSMRMIEAAGAE